MHLGKDKTAENRWSFITVGGQWPFFLLMCHIWCQDWKTDHRATECDQIVKIWNSFTLHGFVSTMTLQPLLKQSHAVCHKPCGGHNKHVGEGALVIWNQNWRFWPKCKTLCIAHHASFICVHTRAAQKFSCSRKCQAWASCSLISQKYYWEYSRQSAYSSSFISSSLKHQQHNVLSVLMWFTYPVAQLVEHVPYVQKLGPAAPQGSNLAFPACMSSPYLSSCFLSPCSFSKKVIT